MTRLRGLHAVNLVFMKQVTAAIDLSDVLRSEVVLAVSALDYFVHEITRLGMLECWSGHRQHTDAFSRYQFPVTTILAVQDRNLAYQAIDSEIRVKHGYLSFQQPDKIADAIRLFSKVKLWEEVGKELNLEPKKVKSALSLIIDRRNQIAHEADLDPSYPDQRWPITVDLVEDIFDQIEKIVRAIYKCVK